MNTIIDTCVISSVFNTKCQKHCEYKPVYDCINNKKICMQIGGKKYFAEISNLSSYIRLFNELIKAGKAQRLNDAEVDLLVDEIASKETNPDFDDPHLIALQIKSNAKLICTDDDRAKPYIKKKELYPKNHKRPKIYSSLRNINLLPV